MARTVGSVLTKCDSSVIRPILTESGFTSLLRSVSIQRRASYRARQNVTVRFVEKPSVLPHTAGHFRDRTDIRSVTPTVLESPGSPTYRPDPPGAADSNSK